MQSFVFLTPMTSSFHIHFTTSLSGGTEVVSRCQEKTPILVPLQTGFLHKNRPPVNANSLIDKAMLSDSILPAKVVQSPGTRMIRDANESLEKTTMIDATPNNCTKEQMDINDDTVVTEKILPNEVEQSPKAVSKEDADEPLEKSAMVDITLTKDTAEQKEKISTTEETKDVLPAEVEQSPAAVVKRYTKEHLEKTKIMNLTPSICTVDQKDKIINMEESKGITPTTAINIDAEENGCDLESKPATRIDTRIDGGKKINSDSNVAEKGAVPVTSNSDTEEKEIEIDLGKRKGHYDDDEGQKEVEEEVEDIEPTSLVQIHDELSSLKKVGSACTGGPASILPALPGLHIEGVGYVSLPVTEDMACKIKQVAKEAPYGHGMETVNDKKARNTFRVEPAKVKLQNPAWNPALQRVTQAAAEGLGVDFSTVIAEFYELLLYEPGEFFEKHLDTEMADGMFGTLVIQLPSIYTGASFIVSHNGNSRTFHLDRGTAAYECQYVAHYTDCEYQIKPVESGYRLALIYSLCYNGKAECKPSANNIVRKDLPSLMKNLSPSNSLFCLPLKHQYTTASLARLGTRALKGEDRIKQLMIAEAGEDDWQTLIVRLKRVDLEWGGGSYSSGFQYEDKEEGEVEFIELYNDDGSDAESHKQWLKQQMDLHSLEADGMVLQEIEEDIEEMWGLVSSGEVEYTDNEGASRERTYTAFVLVAFSKLYAFQRWRKTSRVDATNNTATPSQLCAAATISPASGQAITIDLTATEPPRTATEPPRKRARIKESIPENAEVIEID